MLPEIITFVLPIIKVLHVICNSHYLKTCIATVYNINTRKIKLSNMWESNCNSLHIVPPYSWWLHISSTFDVVIKADIATHVRPMAYAIHKTKNNATSMKLHKKWTPLYTAIIDSAMTTVTSCKVHLERRWAYKHI